MFFVMSQAYYIICIYWVTSASIMEWCFFVQFLRFKPCKAIVSPILFCVYLDTLIIELKKAESDVLLLTGLSPRSAMLMT